MNEGSKTEQQRDQSVMTEQDQPGDERTLDAEERAFLSVKLNTALHQKLLCSGEPLRASTYESALEALERVWKARTG